MIHIALYQPDIPQNTGAAIRLCACLGMTLDIIEPCGFLWDDKKIRKSAMDYMETDISPNIQRHTTWQHFLDTYHPQNRIIAITTKTAEPYTGFSFRKGDILLMGRESAGLPDDVHGKADARLTIPMKKGARSLNVINAASMVASEALRQIGEL